VPLIAKDQDKGVCAACQRPESICRRKVRMSGSCKGEMSAFMSGREPLGNKAHRLAPARTRPTASVAGSEAGALDASRSRAAMNVVRRPGALAAAAPRRARRPGSAPWITRTALEPRVGCFVRAEDPGASVLASGMRTRTSRTKLGLGKPESAGVGKTGHFRFVLTWRELPLLADPGRAQAL
jgi:hypothetical protein